MTYLITKHPVISPVHLLSPLTHILITLDFLRLALSPHKIRGHSRGLSRFLALVLSRGIVFLLIFVHYHYHYHTRKQARVKVHLQFCSHLIHLTPKSQEPITWSLHTCCTLESTLSDKELFLEQAFPRN